MDNDSASGDYYACYSSRLVICKLSILSGQDCQFCKI